MKEPDDLVCLSEAAQYLGIHRATLWRRLRSMGLRVYSSPSNRSKRLISWAEVLAAFKPQVGDLVVSRSQPRESFVFDSYAQRSLRKTGMRVRIVYEDSRVERARLLKARTIDTFVGDSESAAAMIQGEGEYASEACGPFPIRDCFPTLIPGMVSGFLVRNDGQIGSLWDLRKPGLRIADLSELSPRMGRLYRALLAWIDLDIAKVSLIRFPTWIASLRAVLDGSVDVAWATPISEACWELESQPPGIRWLDMNPGASEQDALGAQRFCKVMPDSVFRRNTEGVSSSIGYWGHRVAGHYGCRFVHADANPRFVYELTANFTESREGMSEWRIPQEGFLAYVKAALPELIIPLHEGAIAYFREKQIWRAEDDARQERNLDLLQRYTEAWDQALGLAKARGVPAHPANGKWLDIWNECKQGIHRLRPSADIGTDLARDHLNERG